jgi:cytochrome o ubiquinol oxidase subunit 1
MEHFIFGNLTLADLPTVWYTIGGTASIFALGAIAAGILTYYKRWKWLWKEWLTSTDPKKIGVMYIVVASVMFFRGGSRRGNDLAAAVAFCWQLAGIS